MNTTNAIMNLQDFLKNRFGIEVTEGTTIEEINEEASRKSISFKSVSNRRRKRIKTKRDVCKYLIKEIELAGYKRSKDVAADHAAIYSRYLDVKHVAAEGNINRISFPAIFNVADAFKIKIEFIVETAAKRKK